MDKKLFLKFLKFLKERTQELEARASLTKEDVISLEVELNRLLERFGEGETFHKTVVEATHALSLNVGTSMIVNPPFWYKLLPRFFWEKDMRSNEIRVILSQFSSDITQLIHVTYWLDKDQTPVVSKENS